MRRCRSSIRSCTPQLLMPTTGTLRPCRRRRARPARRGRVRCTMRRGWGGRGRRPIPRHGVVGVGSTITGWGGVAPPRGRHWQNGLPGPTGRRRAPAGRGVRCTRPAGGGRTTSTTITTAAVAAAPAGQTSPRWGCPRRPRGRRRRHWRPREGVANTAGSGPAAAAALPPRRPVDTPRVGGAAGESTRWPSTGPTEAGGERTGSSAPRRRG